MLVALPAFAQHHKLVPDDPSCPSHTGMPTLAFGTNYGQCGTAANGATVVNGDDCAIRVTFGSDYDASETTVCTTPPCGCVLTFTSAFTQAPACVLNSESDSTHPVAVATTTAVDLDARNSGFGVFVGGTLTAICHPAPN